MKVLLIKPPSSHAADGNMVPIGLAYIAAVLKRDGHTVKIHDFTLLSEKWKEDYSRFDDAVQQFYTPERGWGEIEHLISDEIKRFSPDLVGITCNTAERFAMFRIAKFIKNLNKDIPIVVGGTHVTVTAKQTLSLIKDIDIVIRGEGEKPISELCSRIEEGKEWKDVQGTSFRHNGEIISTPRTIIKDLDALPHPARELFENEKYKYRIPFTATDNNVTGIVTSRGCPGHCRFCSGHVFWQGKFRFRNPANVVDEMEYVLSEYPQYDGFWIFDDNFYADNKRAIEICKEIKRRKLDFIWGCAGRVDMINSEVASEMYSAGCRLISFGVESGSDRVLSMMNKETDLSTIKKAIKIVKDNKIIPRGTFIFGWPGETWYDVFKTLRVMWNFEPSTINYGTNVLLYPGTPITNKFAKDFDWCSELPENMPKVYNIPRLVVKGDPYRAKLLNILLKYNFRAYYLTHPRYLYKVLRRKLKRFKYCRMKDKGSFILDYTEFERG